MSDTLYLQVDQNILVTNPHVHLQDIAELTCTSSTILNRLRVLSVINLDHTRPGRYVFSVSDLIQLILKEEPNLTIITIGEPSFILTYQNPHKSSLTELLKVTLICLLAFFGSAFSIMTFNNDVDTGKLFQQVYKQVTGNTSSGFTVLEFSYSVGIGSGILFFFNHFNRKKQNSDPSPMQVQMRQYEDQVNQAILEDSDRTHNPPRNNSVKS